MASEAALLGAVNRLVHARAPCVVLGDKVDGGQLAAVDDGGELEEARITDLVVAEAQRLEPLEVLLVEVGEERGQAARGDAVAAELEELE